MIFERLTCVLTEWRITSRLIQTRSRGFGPFPLQLRCRLHGYKLPQSITCSSTNDKAMSGGISWTPGCFSSPGTDAFRSVPEVWGSPCCGSCRWCCRCGRLWVPVRGLATRLEGLSRVFQEKAVFRRRVRVYGQPLPCLGWCPLHSPQLSFCDLLMAGSWELFLPARQVQRSELIDRSRRSCQLDSHIDMSFWANLAVDVGPTLEGSERKCRSSNLLP